MYQFDAVGRLTPTSLELSRAAATRHAHLEGLRERAQAEPPRRRRLRPQEWLRIMVLPAFA